MTRTDYNADSVAQMISALQRQISLQDLAQVAEVDVLVVRQWSSGDAVPPVRQHNALRALEEALCALERVGVNADQARDWLFDGLAATTGALPPARLLLSDPYRVLAAVHELTDPARLSTSLRDG